MYSRFLYVLYTWTFIQRQGHPPLKWCAVTYKQTLQCTLVECVVYTNKHSFKTSVTLLWSDMQLRTSKTLQWTLIVCVVYTYGHLSNASGRSARSWVSSFSSQTANRPMTILWRYYDTSIFTSRRDGPKRLGSRSRWDRIFEIPYFKEFCLSRPRYFSKNRQKIIKRNFAGLHPAPRPYGAAPLPPTKVDAKRVAEVVLDNPDRALR